MMVKKIDLMETGISLARLFRLAFKNFLVIIISFLLGAGLAFVYTNSPFMDPGMYIAGGAIAYKVNTNATVLNTVVEVIRSRTVAEEAADFLATGDEDTLPVTLMNGDPITASMIQNNLSASTLTNSLRIPVSFSHPDISIVIPVINAVIDASIRIGNSDAYPIIAKNLVLGEYATTIVYDGPSRTLYLAIGALLGLMIGGAVGVLWDAFKGTVYSAQDIKEFGLSSFYVPLHVYLPLSLNTFLRGVGLTPKNLYENTQAQRIEKGFTPIHALTTIQNNLESMRPNAEEPLTTLLVSPLPNGNTLSTVAFAYAKQSGMQGRKTLLIDFDLQHTPFTHYMQRNNLKANRKNLQEKKSDGLLSFGENLDLYLPKSQTIPATFIRDGKTQRLIDTFKQTYEHIILLAPSALPDASLMSMVSYANSALVVGLANQVTTTQIIKTINTLLDAKVDTIETLIVSMQLKTKWPTLPILKKA